MSVLATVSYDTTRAPAHLTAYRVSLIESAAPVTGTLAQHGPVINGSITYRGVFATRGDAARAVLGYVGNAKLVEATGPFGARLMLLPPETRPVLDDHETAHLLASRSDRGVFVAA